MNSRRSGNVLILVAMLLFAVIGLAALVIDIGLARRTQLQLQSVSDASALEAAWNLQDDTSGSTFQQTRDAAVRRGTESTEFSPFGGGTTGPADPDLGLGPREVLLTGGFDLNDDGVEESARLITLGERVPANFNPNTANDSGGDIVTGIYDESMVPTDLPPAPGQPDPFQRGPAFTPDTGSEVNSVLVRARRTGSSDEGVSGATTGGRLPVLFGAFANFGSSSNPDALQLRAEGIAVRSESISVLEPAVAVGPPLSGGGSLPEAIPLAVDVANWPAIAAAPTGVLAPGVVAISPSNYALGAAVNPAPILPTDLPMTGYISITQSITGPLGTPVDVIVAFGMVHVAPPVPPAIDPVVTLLQSSQPAVLAGLGINLPLTGNATAGLDAAATNLVGLSQTDVQQLMATADGLDGILTAPRLTRSTRISP